jgi:hypothetical protein
VSHGKHRDKKPGLKDWQTVIAAIVAALATVAVTFISTGGGSQTGSSQVAPISFARFKQAGVDITSVAETASSSRPPRETLLFHGTMHGPAAALIRQGAAIYVITERSGAPKQSPAQWLVSPRALVSDGRWRVQWTLTSPPIKVRWIAVLLIGSDAPLPPGTLDPPISAEMLQFGPVGLVDFVSPSYLTTTLPSSQTRRFQPIAQALASPEPPG